MLSRSGKRKILCSLVVSTYLMADSKIALVRISLWQRQTGPASAKLQRHPDVPGRFNIRIVAVFSSASRPERGGRGPESFYYYLVQEVFRLKRTLMGATMSSHRILRKWAIDQEWSFYSAPLKRRIFIASQK